MKFASNSQARAKEHGGILMDENCGRCKFYNTAYSQCRISPPIWAAVFGKMEDGGNTIDYRTVWPPVSTSDWCGSFDFDWSKVIEEKPHD